MNLYSTLPGRRAAFIGLGLGLALCLGISSGQAANQTSYTQFGSGNLALGYPVPLPIESQTPVAGFRSYAGLHARHQALALQSADMEGIQVGQTFNGRPIWAYRLSDADDLTKDGEPEPAFLINGGIHAREWQSPEVTTAIIEQLMAGADGHGIERYLLDEGRVIVVPILNVDGFLQTQRYPTQVIVGDDPSNSGWPRDGRMRRKNMRNADENLSTQGDHLNGIDLNRNHSPFWGGGSGNSRNLTYRGSTPNSEPETSALLAAGELGPTSALRSYVDVHSYSRVLFVQNTGNSARDIAANALAGLFIYAESAYSEPGRPEYANSPEGINRGIGTTADHFGYDFQIPAWTLELEPGDNGALDYGGLGASHDGFILPANQIERVRNSVYQAQRLLFYRMLGNAYIREVRVLDASNGELVYEAGWRKLGSARTLEIRRALPLRPGGDYRLWLGFNKPMRLRENGVVSQIPNRNELAIQLAPSISLIDPNGSTALATANGRWLNHPGAPGFGYQHWEDDAYAIDFSVPADASGELRLAIDAQDITGDHLDADPGSVVDWAAGWIGFQSSFPAGDQHHLLQVSAHPSAMVRWAERPSVVAEGDSLRLRLTRSDASQRATVNVRSEFVDSSAADFVPIAMQAVTLEPGSDLVFVLRTHEDLLSEPTRHLRLRLEAADASSVIADPVLDLALLDNDSSLPLRWRVAPAEASTSAPGQEFLQALNAANSATSSVEVDLPPAIILSAPVVAGASSYAPVSGNLVLDGHGSTISASSAARVFEVAPGGSLELRALSIQAAETAAITGDGGLVLNAGQLGLYDLDLVGGHARRGGQVYNSGATVLQRVRMIGGRADQGGAQIYSSGSLQLANSQMLQAVAGNGALWSEGSSTLDSLSLINAQAQPALRRTAGQLQIANSLLLNASNCEPGAGLISGGGNLDGDDSCTLGNLSGAAHAVSLETQGGLPLAVPGSAAVDAGAVSCGSQDYRRAARPQGASARCDIGAIEVGTRPALGIWYDPSRDGSGFAIDLVGNLLFVIWYTYDNDGRPIAYTAQNTLGGEQWSAPLLRFQRTGDDSISSQQVGTLSLQFTANDRAQSTFSFSDGGTGTLALQFLPFAEGANQLDIRGTWAAQEFPFQGLSLIDQGKKLAVLAYYYDGSGTLRWALGTSAANQATRLPMLRYTGSCPACTYLAPQPELAGSVELRFDGRRRAQIHATLDAADGGAWIAEGNRINAF